MSDVEIKGKITLDTAAAAKSTSELNKEIKDSRKAMDDAKIGSQEYVAAQGQLKKAQEELQQATANANGENNKSSEAFGMLKEKLGGLAPGLKGAEEGTKSFTTTLKTLAATPIVLILTGIVLILKWLYDAFTATREGAEKVEAIFAGISAAAQVVTDRILKLGGAVIKFFSGDFKGALSDAKGAITGIGDEIEDKYNRTVELTKKIQQLKREQMQDDVNKSAREKRLALLREEMNDENLSAREKLKIAKELRDDSIKNNADDLSRTKSLVEAQIALIKQKANWEKSSAQEVADLEIKLNNAETENALEVVRVNRQVRAAQKQINAEDKAASEEAKSKAKELRDAAKTQRAQEMAYQSQLRKQEQEITLSGIKDAYAKELELHKIKLADEKKVNEDAVIDGKLTREQANTLNANIDKMAVIEKAAIDEKYKKEAKQKELAFQQELNKIKLDITLSGIEDVRVREKKQLELGYDEKLKQAEEKYKDDAEKLAAIKSALDLQYRSQVKALDKKYQNEDLKEEQAFSLKKIAFEQSLAKNNLKAQKKLLDDKQKIIDQQYKAEILAANNNAAKLKEIELKHLEDMKTFSDAQKAIDNATAQSKVDFVSSIGNSLTQLSQIVGEHTAAGKAFAIAAIIAEQATSIAKIIMNTQAANAKSIAASPLTAGQPWVTINTIQGVIAGAASAAAGARAISALGGSGGTSAPSATAMASAPLAPQQVSTSLNQSSINGIGNAAQGGTSRAFVLNADIKNTSEREARINRAARIA